jgi:hypothetical protein
MLMSANPFGFIRNRTSAKHHVLNAVTFAQRPRAIGVQRPVQVRFYRQSFIHRSCACRDCAARGNGREAGIGFCVGAQNLHLEFAGMTRMKSWILAAGLSAAALAGTAATSLAADLPYRDYGRNGSAYDDPRYADLYGDGPTAPPAPERRYAAPHQPQYQPQHGYNHPPIPREPVYRDEHRPRQYVEVEPRHRAYSAGPGCVARDDIKYGLERDGWRDFRDPQIIDRGTAALTARRNGRLFELKVDRCSGDVITARPLEPRHSGPYADYEGRPPYRTY